MSSVRPRRPAVTDDSGVTDISAMKELASRRMRTLAFVRRQLQGAHDQLAVHGVTAHEFRTSQHDEQD